MKYALLRDVGGRLARACPDCGREEPPWLAPSPGKTPVAVTCPCGCQYRYMPEPTERMRMIVEDLQKSAEAELREDARRLRFARPVTIPPEQPCLGNDPPPPCLGNDPLCPCQDGDLCHYRGPNPWPAPKPPAATPKPPAATPKPPAATPKPPAATPKPPAATEKPPAATPPATPPARKPPAPPPPDEPSPFERRPPRSWEPTPEVAQSMLAALADPEAPPPIPTPSHRRNVSARNLAAESRFLDQQNDAAHRHFLKLADEATGLLPEREWVHVVGWRYSLGWAARKPRKPHA